MNTTTRPDGRVVWVPEPDGRGTAGLLFSCIFTLFLSAWTAYHPDVGTSDHIFHGIMHVIAPEALVWKAYIEWYGARRLHTALSTIDEELSESDSPKVGKLSMTHCFCALMNGFEVKLTDGVRKNLGLSGVGEAYEILKASQSDVSAVSREDIWDKSKADRLMKAFACAQATWFAVQLIARLVQSLAISTVELFTLGNMICALISYVFWWNKPKDMGTSVSLKSPLSNAQFQERRDAGNYTFVSPPRRKRSIFLLTLIGIIPPIAAAPLLGWNASFATPIEETIWRACSIGTIILGLGLALWYCLNFNKSSKETRGDNPFFVVLFLYTLIRLYFLVEIFVGLRSSPMEVYETVDWSRYLPHV